MIKKFHEMDGAISDIFKQITSGKASICEETETNVKPPVHKERSHVSVASSSYKEDEIIIVGSVTSNMCNEENTDAKGTTNNKSCALDILRTSNLCKIIDANTVVSTARGSSKKEEAENSNGISGSKHTLAVAAKSAKNSLAVSVASSSYKEDEVIIVGSVTSNMCNEEQTDAKGTPNSKSCALDISPSSSSCEIIETNTIVSTARGYSKKEEAETSKGISGSKHPLDVTTKSAKRREDNSTIGSDKGSKRRNFGDCLKFETNQLEIKPRSTPINLYDDECAFCHSFRTTELYGPIVCYLNDILVEPKEADQGNVIYVHEKCLDWAPDVFFSGDNVINLEEEIERGEKLICSKCGVKGAVLGCFYGPCRRSYHATCALEIDCSWDSRSFKMLCPAHASEKLDKFIADVPKMEPLKASWQ